MLLRLALLVVACLECVASQDLKKCNDGFPVVKQCNQETLVCDEDDSLRCENHDGIYYCCAIPKNPDPNGGSCSDRSANCASIRERCTDPEFEANMREQCAKTCEFCSSQPPSGPQPAPGPSPGDGGGVGSCLDRAANCASISQLCKQPEFEATMKDQCPKTCNLCSSQPAPGPPPSGPSPGLPSGPCEDKFQACRVWIKSNFCQWPRYTQQQKRDMCGKSCNLCSAAGGPSSL